MQTRLPLPSVRNLYVVKNNDQPIPPTVMSTSLPVMSTVVETSLRHFNHCDRP